MKPVMQTKRGGPDVPPEERGDCWSACLASLLEVRIEDVPVPHGEEVHWWDATRAALEPHGFEPVMVPYTVEFIYPYGYWIAGVPSLNLGCFPDGRKIGHCVVMRCGEVAHDPCIGERTYEVGTSIGDLEVNDGTVLVPLDLRSTRLNDANVVWAEGQST